MPVDTRTVERRDVSYASFSDLEKDLDRIERAIADGTVTATGNWSPGQACEHCAKFMRFAIDGFPSRAPGIVRLFAKMMFKKKALGPEPFPAGFKLPKQAAALLPSPSVSDATGVAELRGVIKRIHDGERMTHPSPLLGPMTHEEWTILQLKHCALHLSFIRV